jgi:hypothetical protein
MIVNLAVFVALAVFGGLGSTWYMIERGSPLTTRSYGPWVVWTAAGRSDADPYTRAHFARRGTLPMSSTISLVYEAKTDSSGRRLRGDCDYVLDGEEPVAAWWSLSAYDDNGQLIANAPGRYSFNSATLMRGAGTHMMVSLGPGPQPGNWLPSGGTGRLTLLLSLDEPGPAGNSGEDVSANNLPEIRRIACP